MYDYCNAMTVLCSVFMFRGPTLLSCKTQRRSPWIVTLSWHNSYIVL